MYLLPFTEYKLQWEHTSFMLTHMYEVIYGNLLTLLHPRSFQTRTTGGGAILSTIGVGKKKSS